MEAHLWIKLLGCARSANVRFRPQADTRDRSLILRGLCADTAHIADGSLREVADFRSHWITVYECPSEEVLDEFTEVGDPRWVFPLLDLSVGVKDRLVVAEQAVLSQVVSRIRMIDYKTVSIIAFEQTPLGCYREADHLT